MRVVGLISGGKDSCYNTMQCVAAGHKIVALANLQPAQSGELDSYMYQTVGHEGISLYAEAMQIPLFQEITQGKTTSHDMLDYQPQEDDEVEDLYRLLRRVKEECQIEGVSVGAILSDYQRIRVENVCSRLGLVSLAYLWQRDQKLLLKEMLQAGVSAVIIKVACLGLKPANHLGKRLEEVYPHLCDLADKYGVNVCGEGGEYETFTLDCPLFHKQLIINDSSVCIHSDDEIAPVAYLKLKQLSLMEKTERVAVNQPVFDHSTFYMEKLTPKTLQKSAEESTSVFHSGPFVWLSISKGKGDDPVTTAESIFSTMKDALVSMKESSCHAVMVYLYLKDMEDYTVVNKVYAKSFTSHYPARVCVQVDLPHPLLMQLDIVLLKENESSLPTSHLHVQSISHWAPANIGPYSQAFKVGDIVFLAGQIGLIPGCMLLASPEVEAIVALDHVISVLKVQGSDLGHVIQGVCYCTSLEAAELAHRVWKKAVDSSLSCPIAYPLVSGLPRGASVEWHVIAVTNQHTVTYSHETQLQTDVLVQTLSALCSSTETHCVQSSITPLITSTDDVNEVKISIPDKLTNTATASNMLRLYQPCGSPELLQGVNVAKLVLPTCGHWNMYNPVTMQTLHINPQL